ncbi:hypothetical protein N7512_000647 [Penicillium capsulatum]|nr:hypothetical protein N7512_000647 [Penicillium capsulatum]
MLSNFVTAAKGLFKRQGSEDELAGPAGTSAAATSEMRKAQPVNTEKPIDKQSKRRKRSSLETAEGSEDITIQPPNPLSANGTKQSNHTETASKKHFRFDSEEPAMPEQPQQQEPIEAPNDDDDSDSDSDDDAPETIDNSAQLIKIKEQAKRQEKLKQREDDLKREKRRKLDERRKLQAQTSKSKENSAPNDDLLSESTTTLQGSTTNDARRRALPALLPDDILNAEPVVRPPTPPTEDTFAAPKKPSKLRFLDKTEKAPKDVHAGDVTIRVLDAPSTKHSSKPSLAPKASKSGRNVKENWLNRDKSTARVNGMRRTAGGSSGFVRR